MKYFIALLMLVPCILYAQTKLPNPTIKIINDSANTSLRGLSAVNDNVVWVSGSKGQVGKSTDGGATWKWMTVKGFEKRDFRDIEAFDSLTAIIMGIGNPAIILKTKDGGETWKTVFEKEGEGMFLDAMDFKNNKEGICIGDPIISDGSKHFFMALTRNGGETWVEQPARYTPQPQVESEAIFAASGSNIKYLAKNKKYWYAFATGGMQSNLYLGKRGGGVEIHNIKIKQGSNASGAFSMCTDDADNFYFAGGDYTKKDAADSNSCYTKNYGKTFKTGRQNPYGYRSCVTQLYDNTFVCTGINGTDISYNNCKTWSSLKIIDTQNTVGFNSCNVSKNGNTLFFVGDKGKIGKLVFGNVFK